MSRKWTILKAAVEQEISFPSEEVFKEYVARMNNGRSVLQVVEYNRQNNGSIIAVVRRSYNNNEFFGKECN